MFWVEAMTEADIDSVKIIDMLCSLGVWSTKTYCRELQSETSYYAVARLAFSASYPEFHRLVGYGGINIILDEGHLTILAVHPKYRRQGIGTLLLKHLIEVARTKGATSLTLEVRESNIGAQQCYAQCGFRPVGFRRCYYPDAENAILMTVPFTANDPHHS